MGHDAWRRAKAFYLRIVPCCQAGSHRSNAMAKALGLDAGKSGIKGDRDHGQLVRTSCEKGVSVSTPPFWDTVHGSHCMASARLWLYFSCSAESRYCSVGAAARLVGQLVLGPAVDSTLHYELVLLDESATAPSDRVHSAIARAHQERPAALRE